MMSTGCSGNGAGQLLSRAFCPSENEETLMKMKMMMSAMLFAMIGTASATGFGDSSAVVVTAGSSASSNAYGQYTAASDSGHVDGSAVLVSPRDFSVLMGSFSSRYSGAASGPYQSSTSGAGGGAVELVLGRNLSAEAVSGQVQEAAAVGLPFHYYGSGQSVSEGSGMAHVSASTTKGSFEAGSENDQLAIGGWFNPLSATVGGSEAAGQILQAPVWH